MSLSLFFLQFFRAQSLITFIQMIYIHYVKKFFYQLAINLTFT